MKKLASLFALIALSAGAAFAAPPASSPECVAARKARSEVPPGMFNAAVEDAQASFKRLLEMQKPNTVAKSIYDAELAKYQQAHRTILRWYSLEERQAVACRKK